MAGLADIVSVFMGLFRIIGNAVTRARVKGIIAKLESRREFKEAEAEEMYFTVGKIISPDYDKLYKLFKSRISGVQTEKFQVKGVFDLSLNRFLVLVLCTDRDVVYDGSINKLAKFVKLFYFKVERIPNQTKVEMCTHTFSDLNEKNLLMDFYVEAEKILK
jgi:hypothetical protein